MKWLTHPQFFNILIAVLASLNSIRWVIYGDLIVALYWFSAALITVSIIGMSK